MRRSLLVGVAALALGLLPACSDDGDSDAFCERLGETDQLGEVLGSLDSSDPAGLEETLRETLEGFRELEADAPGDIRDDVARLRQGVELVLEAVEDNADDLPAVRETIAGQLDELSGLAQAGEAVEGYASEECGIDLGPTAETPTDEAPTDAETTTTSG